MNREKRSRSPSPGPGSHKKERSNTTDGNPNADICEKLQELAEYEKTGHGERYKHRAYRKAAQILSEQKIRVKSGKEAQELPGIGKGIGAKIDEFLATGTMQKVEDAEEDPEYQVLEDLARVPGIGHANAQKLFDQGIRSVDELRKSQDQLTDAVKTGLKYLEEIEKPIPRARVKKIEGYLKKQLKDFHGDFDVTLCGTYRRGEETIREIIAVVTHRSTTSSMKELTGEIIEKLQKAGFITDVITETEHRIKALCILPNSSESSKSKRERKPSGAKAGEGDDKNGHSSEKGAEHHLIELCIYPHDQYYSAVLKWTGNDLFIQEINTKARSKGYLFNEFGLHKSREKRGDEGEAIKVESERDIFKILDMDYVEPKDRSV